ncbi:hypothetical protein G7K_0236-t1 [Saitoella complicata NRRL Y-17804]|uniref:Uncharacterized protein n=1 Tax=Saitoella complicata (strain BCRC 22490 / CBS 7301 / JCM 7358 / NBRC 10748 / NRRL Y-17804) TaxID=698492 RepID=A0A0E9N8G6_SAICN|nr:hypothetical protein G7K_0236-t1 [Saitoella complicata NRRL Y-17804]
MHLVVCSIPNPFIKSLRFLTVFCGKGRYGVFKGALERRFDQNACVYHQGDLPRGPCLPTMIRRYLPWFLQKRLWEGTVTTQMSLQHSNGMLDHNPYMGNFMVESSFLGRVSLILLEGSDNAHGRKRIQAT